VFDISPQKGMLFAETGDNQQIKHPQQIWKNLIKCQASAAYFTNQVLHGRDLINYARIYLAEEQISNI